MLPSKLVHVPSHVILYDVMWPPLTWPQYRSGCNCSLILYIKLYAGHSVHFCRTSLKNYRIHNESRSSLLPRSPYVAFYLLVGKFCNFEAICDFIFAIMLAHATRANYERLLITIYFFCDHKPIAKFAKKICWCICLFSAIWPRVGIAIPGFETNE